VIFRNVFGRVVVNKRKMRLFFYRRQFDANFFEVTQFLVRLGQGDAHKGVRFEGLMDILKELFVWLHRLYFWGKITNKNEESSRILTYQNAEQLNSGYC
jgi:hypothetical protein